MIFKVSRSDRIADGRAETAAAGQDPGSSLRSLDLFFFWPSQDLQATSETISRAWRGSVCEKTGVVLAGLHVGLHFLFYIL